MRVHLLQDLQESIVHYLHESLKEDEDFMNVKVYSYNQFERQIAFVEYDAMGRMILVFAPLPSRVIQNLPGPTFDEIAIRIRILEDTYYPDHAYNRSLWIGEKISQKLHLWTPPLQLNPLVLAENEPWEEVQDAVRPDHKVLELKFTTSLALHESSNKEGIGAS